MSNLFSVFDPHAILGLPLNWLSALTCVLTLPMAFHVAPSQWIKNFKLLVNYIVGEFTAIFGSMETPGSALLSFALFFYIAMNNFLGLCPYIFTSSSHLSFTISLALPLWLGHMIYASLKTPNSVTAHLVPLGTPYPLMPFMVIIELISSIIRPLTLSVRLAANMVAGHLLLTLLSSQAPTGAWFPLLLVLSALLALGVLESAVAIIQAYVFSVLSTLYLSEVSSPSLSSL